MRDEEATLADLKQHVLAFVQEREWERFHSPKNLSMALAGEAAELMEHFLWMENAESLAVFDDARRREKVTEELADVVIYALEFANVCGIDLAAAIEDKVQKNGAKYPVEKARGNARKYTEL